MSNTIEFEYFSINTYEDGAAEIIENNSQKIIDCLPNFDQAYALLIDYSEQYDRGIKNK